MFLNFHFTILSWNSKNWLFQDLKPFKEQPLELSKTFLKNEKYDSTSCFKKWFWKWKNIMCM